MCLVCKKDAEMKPMYFSNDITINEMYGFSDDLMYCSYCGAVFIINFNLGKNKEEEPKDE